MTRVRVIILLMFSMSSALSVFWGFALERVAKGIIVDFKVVYYGARCLIEHHDPYNENELMRVYLAEGGMRPSNPIQQNRVRQVVALQVYVPTAFIYIAPFAILPWGIAHALWAALTAVAFTLAAFLMWTLSQDRAPGASFYLMCFLLANCGILFSGGNPAGLAVGLCAVGAWCFLQGKNVGVGVICLAVGLALKPHDTGFVWLYFLLAGGVYRRRALQTLGLTITLALPAILWISLVSPHWVTELLGNLAATSVRGGITDPGPNSMSGSGGGMMINLQTVVSIFRDDSHFYNPITYVVCGALFLVWIIITLRGRPCQSKDYLALAVVAALSMLPLYHRPHDAKLLILTLPACAMLIDEGGIIGRMALVLNSTAIILTSDFPLAFLAQATKGLNLSTNGVKAQLLMVILGRPMTLILLALGIFYLWVYMRRCLHGSASTDVQSQPSLVGSEQPS